MVKSLLHRIKYTINIIIPKAKGGRKTDLSYTQTGTFVHIPQANYIIVITRAKNVHLIWVEV